MKNALPFIVVLIVLIIAAGLFLDNMLGVRDKPVRGYLDLIQLSNEQKQKVEEIRKEFLPKVEKVRKELRQKRLQLNDLLFASKPDMKAIDDKTGEIADLQTKLEKEVINHILQEKEILTLDQQKQFHEIIEKEFKKGSLGIHGETSVTSNGRP